MIDHIGDANKKVDGNHLPDTGKMVSDTPTQCQFCGADIDFLDNGKSCKDSDVNWMAFRCLTSWHRGEDNARRFQSKPCEEAERQNLYARIKRLEEAGDAMVNGGWNEPHLAGAWRKAKEAKP